MSRLFWGLGLLLASTVATAQLPPPAAATAPRGEGTLVVMPGQAQLQRANDEALLSFFVEVQDADPARAQSLVNQRLAQGSAALRRADPQAQLESAGYQTFPVYSNTKDAPPRRVAWRVRQSVNLRTTALDALARTVQAGQGSMTLGSVVFSLSRAAREKAEAELIALAIANVRARIAAAAQSLAVPSAQVRIEELSFNPRGDAGPMPMMAMRAAAPLADELALPSFAPGQTTESLAVVARVRFLP